MSRVSTLLLIFSLLAVLPFQASAFNTNPKLPKQEIQQDSIMSSQDSEMLYYEDEEMSEGNQYVFDTPSIEEEIMEEEMQTTDESPVSFNVFYYLLEKFKFSNNSKTTTAE